MSKSIVIYFSRADENYGVDDTSVGNTELLAKEIIKSKQADEFKIEPVTPYPANYQDTVNLATKEFEDKIYPEYTDDVNLDSYDTVYLGYPIWWGDIPMIVQNFLNNHNWQGKTIYPFCTHEGSGNAGTFTKLKSTLDGADVKPGFDCYGHETRNESGINKLISWL